MAQTAVANALDLIERTDDPKALKQMAANARRIGQLEVARAAELKLYERLPSEKPGTLEHDVWRSIYALEGTLSHERGKATRLSRTRQKIARVGELQTVSDLVLSKKPSEGFTMLVDRQMANHTFEALTLRHADRFSEESRLAAAARLQEAKRRQQVVG